MNDNPAIDDLIRRLEAATGPDRVLDAEIDCLVRFHHFRPAEPDDFGGQYGYRPGNIKTEHGFLMAHHYTSSIDAALTLVPIGWYAIITARGDGPHCVLQEFPQPCRRVPENEPYVIRSHCTDVVAGSAITICICALAARALPAGKANA